MKELNCEQRVIVNDILCKKNKYSRIPLHIFSTRGARCKHKKDFDINTYYTKHVTILHNKNYKYQSIELEIIKLTYTGKTSFDINNSTIHYAHVINISLNPNQ
jgi:hypothetical protein